MRLAPRERRPMPRDSDDDETDNATTATATPKAAKAAAVVSVAPKRALSASSAMAPPLKGVPASATSSAAAAAVEGGPRPRGRPRGSSTASANSSSGAAAVAPAKGCCAGASASPSDTQTGGLSQSVGPQQSPTQRSSPSTATAADRRGATATTTNHNAAAAVPPLPPRPRYFHEVCLSSSSPSPTSPPSSMLLKQREAYNKWLHAPLVVGLTDKDQAILAASLIPTTNVDVAAEVMNVLATAAAGNSGQSQRGKGGKSSSSSSAAGGMAAPCHLHPSHKPLMTFIAAQQEERDRSSNANKSTSSNKGASVSSKAPSSSSSSSLPLPSSSSAPLPSSLNSSNLHLASPLPLFKDCYRRCSLCHKLVVLRYAEKHTTSAACMANRLPSAGAVAAADEECKARIRLMGIQMDFEEGSVGSKSGGGVGNSGASGRGAFSLEAAAAFAGSAPPTYAIPLPLSPSSALAAASGVAGGFIDEGFVRQFTMLVVNNLASRFENRFGGGGGRSDSSDGSSSSCLSELLYGWAGSMSGAAIACPSSSPSPPTAVIVSAPTPLAKEAPVLGKGAKGTTYYCDGPATPNVPTPAVAHATATASTSAVASSARGKAPAKGGSIVAASSSASVPPTPTVASAAAALQPPSTPCPPTTVAAVSKQSSAAAAAAATITSTSSPALSPALFASWLALPCYYAVEDREVAGMCAALGLLPLSRHCDWAAAAEAYGGLVGVSADDDAAELIKKKNGVTNTLKKQPIAIAPYSPSSLLLLAGGGGGKGGDAAVGGLALPHDPLDAEGNYIRRKGKWPAMPVVPDVPTYIYSAAAAAAPWPTAKHLIEHHQRRLKGLAAIAAVSASSQQSALRRCSCCLSLISYRNFARHERSEGCTAAGQDFTGQSYIHRRVLGDVEHRLFANGASGAPSTAELRVIRACVGAGMGAMRSAAVAADPALVGRDGCGDAADTCNNDDNANGATAAAQTESSARIGAKRGRGGEAAVAVPCSAVGAGDGEDGERTRKALTKERAVADHSAAASVKEKEKEAALRLKAIASALAAAEKEERGPRGGIEREEAAAFKLAVKEEREARLVADKAAKEALRQTAALRKAAEKEVSAKMALAAQRRAVIAQFVPYTTTPLTTTTATTAADANKEQGDVAGNANQPSSSTLANASGAARPHPPQPQRIPIPTVRCYAPCYASTRVAGVPFLLGTDICGVVFKDTSCVTLTTKGVLTYVNRHRHRFSLRPPSKDARITVPSRLEKKVAAVLWVREVFTHQESARHALGFVDVPPPPSPIPSNTPTAAAAATNATPSPLVAGSSNISDAIPSSVRTIPCPRHFITADDFGASCDAMRICPLAMLSMLATGGGGDTATAAAATEEGATAAAPQSVLSAGPAAPLLPPLPLYVSSVEGIDWGGGGRASAASPPLVDAHPRDAIITFTVSNHSALYPNQVYYDSDGEGEGEDNDNAVNGSKQ